MDKMADAIFAARRFSSPREVRRYAIQMTGPPGHTPMPGSFASIPHGAIKRAADRKIAELAREFADR